MHGDASSLGATHGGQLIPLALRLKSLGVDADGIEEVLQVAKRPGHIAAGTDVVRPGEAPKHCTVLLSGMTCSYVRIESGIRNILSFHHAGDFCDLHRYVLPERGGAFGVQALTGAVVAVIDHCDMDRLLANSELALAFWRATMFEAAIYRQRLINANRGSPLQRVAHLLCEQLARREAVGLGAMGLPISLIDVADATGLSALHINRTIKALRNRGILSTASHSIEVTDRKQLSQIAKFDGGYLNMRQLLSRWTVRIEDRIS